jgi:hypothetical protein
MLDLTKKIQTRGGYPVRILESNLRGNDFPTSKTIAILHTFFEGTEGDGLE